jgi:hypothetical protein
MAALVVAALTDVQQVSATGALAAISRQQVMRLARQEHYRAAH